MPSRLRSRPLDDFGDQSGVITESNAMSMVSRVQERVEELRRIFDLPPEEMFMDEFYCALHKKILLQGRMYVFENYVCFYSYLFGWVKQKVIPLSEVVEVSKKRNYGFPNSIQISWKGKKEFFTSFLSRDDAFTLIVNAWGQAKMGKSMDAVHDPRHASDPSMGRRIDQDGASEPPCDSPAPYSSSAKLPRTASQKRDSFCQCDDGKSPADPDSVDHDTESDPEDEDTDSWIPLPGPVPALPDGMTVLREDDFDVPVRDFFQRILSSESLFLEEYHQSRGDQRYRLSQWQRHSGLEGVVRHATFMSPVKTPGGFRMGLISPKETECNQNQRYRVYERNVLVFETSQVMKDIPYGDNFTVETRWHVFPTPNGCRVAIYGHVPFVRTVISPIRMMIESSVMKELRDSMGKLFQLLSDTLAEVSSPPIDASMGERSWSGILTDNIDEILSRHDLRAKLLSLLREGLGESERRELLSGVPSCGDLSGQQESIQAPTTPLQATSPFVWAERMASVVPPRVSSMLLTGVLSLVLLVQIVGVILWLYPPHGQYRQFPAVHMAPDRMYWHQSLTYISQDLQTLHDRLEVLSQGVAQALDQIQKAKFYETSEL